MTAEERMRERAAEVCDQRWQEHEQARAELGSSYHEGAADAADQCESAIRALPLEGEQGEPAPAREPAVEEVERFAERWNGRVYDAIPFGLAYELAKKNAEELDRLRAENAALHERLEDNFCFDINGNRKEVKPGSIPDGIECRNTTIRVQDEILARLRAEEFAGIDSSATLRAEILKLEDLVRWLTTTVYMVSKR